MIESLLNSTMFVLFVIIALGFIVGRINIKGITLDVSAVIFVALLFGHFGVVVPAELGNFGMTLFIFAIGIQAGPGFFSTFKSKGKALAGVATVLVLTAAVVALATKYIFGFNAADTAGLLAGALTSTPGLATAREITGNQAAISYGIAYPFGVIGVILFVKLLPRMLRIDLRKEEAKLDADRRELYPDIVPRAYRVSNPLVVGRELQDIKLRLHTGAVISRILRGNESILPKARTVLQEGDQIKVVGTPAAHEKVRQFVGEQLEGELPFGENVELQTGLVTAQGLVNRTLGSLNLQQNFHCIVTRVRRAGIDLSPSPSLALKFGDKLTLVGRKDTMEEVLRLIGNDGKRISDTDFLPIALGIALGAIVGRISLSFSDSFTFSFGLTGGVLLMALVLSAAGKTGPVIWTMSGSANQLLRQLGLLLFLANVGTAAGQGLVETFMNSGWSLFVGGFFITLVPMVVATLVARYCFRIGALDLLGTLTGGMTSTPGLAAADSMSDSSAVSVAYATVYPVAMVLLIICIQIVSMIVG
ncbi:MAG: transporter [Rikenella sp.]|nr:transporter [Rikenella sp.]